MRLNSSLFRSMNEASLISKYNVPGPRYTSYPTVPYWEEDAFNADEYINRLRLRLKDATEGVSLYVHLPYCESLCTFCGCNKRITKNHAVEIPYIDALLMELDMYIEYLGFRPAIREIHFGGGTPTFFAPSELNRLMEGIKSRLPYHLQHSFSFEGHPNSTRREHLEVLYNQGFRRVSYGVQDYNPIVQKAIHRIQSLEQVQKATHMAREVGFTGVGHDLIFGLPKQTLDGFQSSIEETIALGPDRIALYSYAHVPWIKGNGQRGFEDSDLPSAELKRKLYEQSRDLLLDAGYIEIGMDHFALPDEALNIALENGSLHRNFMGYTEHRSHAMIGLGVSSIGDAWMAFGQNEKTIEAYLEAIADGRLPLFRGHLLNAEDLTIREHILNLMCGGKTAFNEGSRFEELEEILAELHGMEEDGLIRVTPSGIEVKAQGRPFLRNLCMAFDLRLKRKQPDRPLFSMTI